MITNTAILHSIGERHPGFSNDEDYDAAHPIDPWEVQERIGWRERQMDGCMSEYKRLMDVMQLAYEAKPRYDQLIATRTHQIILAKKYPDPDAPEWVTGDSKAVTRTDAKAIAEAEVRAGWEGPTPKDLIEHCDAQIKMVLTHAQVRGAQMNGLQTLARVTEDALRGTPTRRRAS